MAAVVTTPIDVVKTRIMLAAAQEGTTEKKGKGAGTLDALGEKVLRTARPRKGSMQIAREIVAEQGVAKGLFRGGALRAVWTMLGSGLYLGVYDGARLWLGQRNGKDVEDLE